MGIWKLLKPDNTNKGSLRGGLVLAEHADSLLVIEIFLRYHYKKFTQISRNDI